MAYFGSPGAYFKFRLPAQWRYGKAETFDQYEIELPISLTMCAHIGTNEQLFVRWLWK